MEAGGDACTAQLVAAEAVEEAAREESDSKSGSKEDGRKGSGDEDGRGGTGGEGEEEPLTENGGNGARTGKRCASSSASFPERLRPSVCGRLRSLRW